jgi:hypothetical protein
MRRIKISYQTVTPESAEDGDYADHGWIDEDGVCIEPDDCDIEDYGGESDAVIALAAKTIRDDCGGVEASDYPKCYPGHTWYTQIDADKDYSDGSETTRSYHLDGFSVSEELGIYAELTGR